MSINTLFIQSQSFFGADTELHVQLMRYFDRDSVDVHVALTTVPSGSGEIDLHHEIRSIQNIHVLDADFGGTGGPLWIRAIRRPVAMLFVIGRLRRYVRRHDIQIVHGTEKPRDAITAVVVAKLSGARSIVHTHVSYGDWMSRIVKWSVRHADGLISVSEFTRQSFVNAGVPQQRVHKVLNALDVRSGRWNSGRRDAVRTEFGISHDVVLIGIVSRLFSYKGHLDLLAALAVVDDSMPDYRVLIVGVDDPRGNPADGRFSDQIKETARRLELENRIIFAGFRTDMPDLMAAFDLYAMPSWEEPFGMVYVEAMAMGKPVIAWNQAGPVEIVVDGEVGTLVEPKDIAALAEAILDLSTNADKRGRFGVAGRQRVLERFDSPRMCRDVIAVYERVLADPKRS